MWICLLAIYSQWIYPFILFLSSLSRRCANKQKDKLYKDIPELQGSGVHYWSELDLIRNVCTSEFEESLYQPAFMWEFYSIIFINNWLILWNTFLVLLVQFGINKAVSCLGNLVLSDINLRLNLKREIQDGKIVRFRINCIVRNHSYAHERSSWSWEIFSMDIIKLIDNFISSLLPYSKHASVCIPMALFWRLIRTNKPQYMQL